ncbi:type IV conjugative transfer system protein TraE [Turicimonas muris]
MNIHEYTSELASRLAVRKFFIYAFAASLGVNLILAGGIVAMEDKSRVVVLPAEPSKSFWMDDKTVSPEYLEQMSSYLVQLALNNSPETFEHNMTQLLKYADPEKRGDIELMLLKQGRQMKSSNSSTSFIPQSVEVLPRSMKVVVSGNVRQFIGNVLTSTTQKCWTLQFRYAGTRLWVQSMHETNCKKPFENSSKKGA